MIIGYRKNKDTLTVLKTYVDLSGFRLANAINIDLEQNGDIEFDIKKCSDSSFYLIKHYKNNKGIFIQKYDFSFNKIGIKHNIQSTPDRIKLDVYDNTMIVAWTEVTDGNSLYIQILQDEIITKKTKILDLETPLILKDIQISTLTQNINFYTIPEMQLLIIYYL